MADTYEAFYNGKPLNPNRGLPTMTYAQAEDCGLTESERLWCRADGEDTPVTADDIPYDSNNSVKDKIDDVDTKLAPLTRMAVDYIRLTNLNVDIATLFANGIRVHEALYPSSASNAPSGGGAGYLVTLIWDSNNYATQVAFSQDTLGIYMRKYANGSWTAWTKMSAN